MIFAKTSAVGLFRSDFKIGIGIFRKKTENSRTLDWSIKSHDESFA
jgi:hypothetical protein